MTLDLDRLRNPKWVESDGQSLVLDPDSVPRDMAEGAAEIERLRALVMLGDFSGLRPNSDSFKLVQQIRREQPARPGKDVR